jgi:hypothetical protein
VREEREQLYEDALKLKI